MSQCHDIYDFEGYERGRPRPVEGTGCHDLEADRGLLGHDFLLDIEEEGPARTVRVDGRLDWATADGFREQILDLGSGQPVVIDLSGATIDSAGTGTLLTVALALKDRSQPAAVVATDPVQSEVFMTVGLAGLVPVTHSVAAALARLTSASSVADPPRPRC
jgi:anti-anti-sigma factor